MEDDWHAREAGEAAASHGTPTDGANSLTHSLRSLQLADVNVQQLMMFNEKDKQMMDLLKEFNRNLKAPSHEVVQNVKLALRQPTKQWFDGFVNSSGITILMESIKSRLAHYPFSSFDAVVLLELLECFKFIMKDEYGMNTVINSPGAVGIITMCLDFNWDRVCLAVMEILSVTCYSSDIGHNAVLESMDRLWRRRMEKPFDSLVDAIRHKPMKVKVAAMTLINTLIIRAPELDDRLRIRNNMASLELFEVWEEVLTGEPKEEIREEEDQVRMSTISTGLLDDEGRKADPFGTKIAPHLGVMAGPAFLCPLTLGNKVRTSIFGGGGNNKPEEVRRSESLAVHIDLSIKSSILTITSFLTPPTQPPIQLATLLIGRRVLVWAE